MSKDHGKPGTRKLLRKIFITVAASAATFAATAFVDDADAWPLMLSAFVGGVTLVVQFLLDVEARQLSVDTNLLAFALHQTELTRQLETAVKIQLERFNQANSLLSRLDSGPLGRQPVVELLQHAADLHHSAPALAHRLAESEISDLSNFLKDLGRGREVTEGGDGWPWTFTLTASVQQTIDATSYSAQGDKERSLRDDDMWKSELGQDYLELQALAVERGVAIRRIFILENPRLAKHSELLEICEQQCGLGIDVRLIDASTAAGIARSHTPMVIFDNAISFELTTSRFPDAAPGFIKTTLVLNPFLVHERVKMFQRLWEGASKYESV